MVLPTDIKYAAKLLYDAYKIPVQYVDALQGIIIDHRFHGSINPVYPSTQAFIASLFGEEDALERPLLKVSNFMEHYLLLHVGKQQRMGTLIIGPTLATNVSKEVIEGILLDHQIPLYIQEKIQSYYGQLARISLDEWLHIGQLAVYLLFQQKIDKLAFAEPNLSVNLEIAVEKDLQSRRLETDFHMNHRLEQQIWHCVRDGERNKLTELLNHIKPEGWGLLSKKSQIRNIKNQAIVSVALATRAAVEGGLYPEIAYTMSDAFIQQIEDTSETNRIYYLSNKYLHDLTSRVHANKQDAQSRAVAVCKNYIFDHLFERITVHTLAQLVRLHPVYLSHLFKKETGFPVNQYIQREKIREAQKLLVQSDLSVTAISGLLQFNDQSYFTSTFKKLTGVTPKQYRKNPQPPLPISADRNFE
ncbi:helix-turn-helix domain-containing protein [Paenibacillus lactis]|uniref:helix-turn-helix domain-containing protein n=1 Tax=Paenibacillus lactis TaxID=228574 RepID=UPI001AFF6413|nr:helix-turn-helix domain-containing protein [Paenibacillus lactis]GIO92071.1 AraC family transcriptional regulator [Paenibacillus lactis]